MAAKPSMTGITTTKFDQYDKTPGTGVIRQVGSVDKEARRVTKTKQNHPDPAKPITPSAKLRASAGSKVGKATKTKGGSI